MIRLEGVLDAQLYAGAAQGACGPGVDCFHSQVGQLVGHIVVGAADGDHLVDADLIRVRAGEVVFLVDDRFAGAGGGGDLGEGDLAVAAVEGLHLAFAAVGVAGADHQLPGKVDTGEAVADHVAEALGLLQIPAGQVDQTGIDTGLLERQHGVEGAVRLAQGGEHLAHLEQVLVQLEVAVGTQFTQVAHAFGGVIDTTADEAVCCMAFIIGREQLGVLFQHGAAYPLQRVQPGVLALRIGEAGVHARLAALLVFQQQVGHAAIGGHHEDAVVQLAATALTGKDGIQYFVEAAH